MSPYKSKSPKIQTTMKLDGLFKTSTRLLQIHLLSQKVKKSNNSFFTPNCYEVLKVDNETNETNEMNTELVPQPPSPSPIFITSNSIIK
jgi:hypothetical protein